MFEKKDNLIVNLTILQSLNTQIQFICPVSMHSCSNNVFNKTAELVEKHNHLKSEFISAELNPYLLSFRKSFTTTFSMYIAYKDAGEKSGELMPPNSIDQPSQAKLHSKSFEE